MPTVAELFVRCLEAEGVQRVFGVPGEEVEDLLFAFANSTVQFIPTRHEQGAAFMADVYGRLTGKAGVCLATLGPGATNLVTGVADAHLDKAPVVAITGQGGLDRLHKESHQFINIVDLFKPITKWNTSITHPQIVTEAVRKAFKLAETEKPGATHLELPEDIAAMPAPAVLPIPPKKLRRAAPDHKSIHAALDLIRTAKRPLIVAGNGAIRKLASKHLRLFAEQTNIPVVHTFMGKGAISDRSPLSLFAIGSSKDFNTCAIAQADLLITVGYDIAEADPEKLGMAPKKIIHIDFTPAEVYSAYEPEVEIVCDISAALWELAQRSADIRCEPWAVSIRQQMEEELLAYQHDEGFPITLPKLVGTVREVLRDTDILISDVGSHKMWIARNFPAYEPNTVIISNGFASMGISMPGAIAAKLALPDRTIVSLSGDGGFLMNSQEIETAKRLGLKFVMIVANDNDYGLISWKQQAGHGKSFGTQLTNPDFVKYAESFGIRGYRVESAATLKSVLAEAIASNALCLIEVPVDASVNMALTKRRAAITCVP